MLVCDTQSIENYRDMGRRMGRKILGKMHPNFSTHKAKKSSEIMMISELL